ncbi:DNRLRE domain-containing protein [Blastococcus montanus]|uniref:DNRLRE domain-containing protein n=1 Tax=Blastococcus montanus TaxID=3144973 RepID=UPI003208477C
MKVRSGFQSVTRWRSRGVLGLVVAAALSMSLLEAVPAQAAPDDRVLPDAAFEGSSQRPVPVPSAEQEPAPADVPPPALPPAPELPPVPEGLWPERDLEELNAALLEAARTGRPVELESETTETSISFAQPDGTVQVQTAAGPVRTEVDGDWIDVDTTLRLTENGVEPVAVTGEITFSPGGAEPMVRLSDGVSATLRLDWDGRLPEPELDGNTATYRNVMPHVDLVLSATRVGFEQHLVVKQRPNRATLATLRELQFPVAVNGAEMTEGKGGQLLVEDDGKVVGTAAAPIMWDSRTDPRTDEPVLTKAVGLDLADPMKRGTDSTLVLSPDMGMLTDPATVYPVTIDPTQALGPLGDTFVQSSILNTPQGGATELRSGTYDGGRTVARSLLRFDVSPVFNRVVQSANLALYHFHSWSCDPRWVDIRAAGDHDPARVTWGNQPGIDWSVAGIKANAHVAACPARWIDFNLTGWVAAHADARNGAPAVMPLAVTAGSEGDNFAWKKFNSGNAGGGVPTLTFAYDGRCDQYHGVLICGAIRDKWHAVGAWNSVLGLPIQNETCGLVRGGCFSHFQGGSIYWSPATGAQIIKGSIRDKWASMGWENSYLGYPTTDEVALSGGWFNHFEGGSIYGSRTPGMGFHDISGPIRDTWAGLGWENGWLGYPTSGPIPVAGGTRQEFHGGNILFDTRANATTVGAGVLKHPTQFQRVTQARTQLQATAKLPSGGGTYDGVRFQWRAYSLTPAEGWTDVNPGTLSLPDGSAVSGTWLPLADANGGKESTVYTWNATTSIPIDGLFQVRACLRVAGGTTERCTGVTQITVDRAGLTGANATSDAGPGTVGLLTGAYAVVGRDAEFTAPHGGIAATRSFTSNDPDRPGPLGPGWRMSLAVDEAGADFLSLVDRVDTALITRGDGTQMPFVRKSAHATDVNNYVGDGEASTEASTLTFVPGAAGTASSYVLTDLDGDKVTFTRADGGNGHLDRGLFRVTKVEAIRGKAGSTDLAPAVTTVVYTAAGNPRFLLAPTDAGAACPDPSVTTQPAGCRALEFVYTGSGAGERLAEVRLRAHGAAAPDGGLLTADTPVQAHSIVVATYRYDAQGRLASAADPRSGTSVGYTYRSDGRLATVTPVGATATWTLGYDDRLLPRLVSATLDDGPDGLPPQRTSVRYELPLDGSNAALPALTSAEIGRWGQKVRPTDMTAVFGADVVPAATPTAAQWRGAQLLAMDVNGRVVNTANFGGTVNQDTGADQAPAWRISTTEYDAEGRGNVVRELTAGNRDRALAVGTDAAAQAAQSRLLDTVHAYSADGVDLLRSYQPARLVTVAAGDRQVSARTRTTTTYDTGAEAGHPTPGTSRRLPVRTTVDAVEIHKGLPAGSTGTDPALPALDGRSRVTTLEYGTPNAWKLGAPSATRVDPGGGAAEVVTRQVIDEQGRTVSSTLPAGGTSTATAATTVKVYYSATSGEPGCASEAWAGWLCKSRPGGAPDTGAALPSSHVTRYDVYGNVVQVVETGAGVTRVVNTAYDAAGRPRRSGISGTGPEVGLQRPEVGTTYTAAGLVETTRLLAADGSAAGAPAEGTGPITRTYDAYGRLVSYTDGSGLVTTQSYDAVGRLITVANEHGTRTVGYDGDGERGSLPTSLDVSGIGVFTARYGADGSIVREELPGGLSATTVRDAAGDSVSLRYVKTAADGSTSEWLKSTATINGFDQVDSYRTVAITGLDRTNRYGYDNLGRLVTATDSTARDANGLPTGASCTRRYTFDVNGNRVGLAQSATAGAPAGTCPATVAAAAGYGYDTADRLKADAARATLRYDALGRTRVLPSVDTVDQGGDVALDYFVDDLVAGMSQAGRTTVFGLDATGRRVVRTDTDGTTPGARRATSLYSGDDDNPDVVKEPDNSYTRNISSFGGLASVVTKSGTSGAEVALQLANLHGDVAATVPAGAESPIDLRVTETTEYGLPRVRPAAGTTQARYGWLGTHQRDASTIGGLTLMGVRLYAPTLGRFLTVDPVEGGNPNAYVYPADPVNMFDLDGRWGWAKKAWKKATRAVVKTSLSASRWLTNSRWGKRINRVCTFAIGPASAVCGVVYTAAYARQGRFREAAVSAVGLIGGNVVTGALKRGYSRAYTSAAAASTKRYPVPRRPGRAWRVTAWTSSELHGMAVGATIDRIGNRRR